MTQTHEHLDTLIDELLCGNQPDPGIDDPELNELLEIANEVRDLQEPVWPDDHFQFGLASRVVQRLQASQQRPHTHSELGDFTANDGTAGPGTLPKGTDSAPTARTVTPIWRHRARQLLEMAAAAAVLVLVTGGLILAYQNLIGAEEHDIGLTSTSDSQVALPSVPALDFGHYDDAALLDTMWLGSEDFQFDVENASATLHRASDGIVEVHHHYQDALAEDGWVLGATPRSERVAFLLLDRDDQIAVVMLVQEGNIGYAPEVSPLTPFDLNEYSTTGVRDVILGGEVFIETVVFSCAEDDFYDCTRAVARQLRLSLIQ